MMNTLRLTDDEAKSFQKLSAGLREGWLVQAEDQLVFETGDELLLRYRIARFTNPALQAIASKAVDAKNSQAFDAQLASFDIAALQQDQMAELFFVLGTRIVSAFVQHLLTIVTTDDDLKGVAGMTMIRRMLLEANSESAT